MPTPEEITAQNAQNNQGQNTSDQGATPESWDKFMESQSDNVKDLYTTHTTGLTSALKSERDARDKAEKQLRDLAKKAEKGSELEVALNKQADDLHKVQRQTSFQDRAHTAQVRNLKLAFIAADQAGLVDDKGDCDFTELRKIYPELFTATVQGNAGSGTGNQAQQAPTMDQIIMGALGRTKA